MSKILLQALGGHPTPRRPVWIMRQAGRYLPEYRELRGKATFEELAGNAELAAEVTLQPLRRFPLDAAIVFADLMSPVGALGIPVRFDPGPVLERPVRDAASIRALPEAAPEAIAPEVMETLRRVKRELAPGVTLLGFGGAPWTLAAYLVEGQGKSGFPRLRALMHGDPALFQELLGKVSRLVTAYLLEQHRAGADAVQVFDSWAGLLSAADWTAHVRPHLATMLEELGRAGVPRLLFAHEAPHLTPGYAALPAEGLALCWRSDLAEVRRSVGPARALQGNLDPAVLLAGPAATRRATQELLRRVPARGHVVNLGHGILPETPLESVQALLDVVHEEKIAS